MVVDTIITDMDDTLFNEEGKISEFTLGVMKKCLEQGIRVIPSSGRAQASMEPYMRQLNTGLPYIACNGGQLVNADHTLMDNLCLSPQVAQDICAYLAANDYYAQVYRDEYVYYAQECTPSEDYKRSSGLKGEAVGDLVKFITFDTPKVLCISDPKRIEELYPRIVEHFSNVATFSISKPFFLEAMPPEATKGAAIHRLAAKMPISPEKTFVFGDSLNDISMLAYTKNSVAVGNARDEVKAVARYICRPNSEDGMARFIQENLLH